MSYFTDSHKPVALVTGGAKRLGKFITESLLVSHHVVVHYNNSSEAAEILRANHPQLLSIRADLTLPGAPAKLIENVVEQTGQLNLLVNNAAVFFSDAAELVDLAKMKTLNLDAPVKLIESARPHLSKTHGQIINIADIAAIQNFSQYKAYSRSKAALLEYMASHALPLAREQIRVNTICPGLVLPSSSQRDSDTLDTLQQQIPLQRIGHPEDVSSLVAFLASSSFITGQVIAVDGGRLLNYTQRNQKTDVYQ